MKRTDEGLILEGDEPYVLAFRLATNLVGDWSEHIDWEDVPNLVESSWLAVVDELEEVARELLHRSRQKDEGHDIDSKYLHEEATDTRAAARPSTEPE